ncbi:MAG: class D sortase [Anaerolineales bacterium]|jgi:sortase A
MAKDHRPADELSVEELEALLARKKMQARQARLRKFRDSGRALRLRTDPPDDLDLADFRTAMELEADSMREARRRRLGKFFSRLLLLVEIAAAVALGFVLFNVFGKLQFLNREAAQAMSEPTSSPTPLITAVVLPSGHMPPTSPGGARPNEDEIPENLRPLVQSMASVPIPTTGPEHAQSIFIPALWNAPAPVVQGDGWEQLKKGIGQHIGSANPGQVGNMVLSGHNDIFGELFRYLDQLKPGDEIILSTAARDYVYRVTGVRIVEPTEVGIMAPTTQPTVTLISCYPYLVDNQRIAVFGELVDS